MKRYKFTISSVIILMLFTIILWGTVNAGVDNPTNETIGVDSKGMINKVSYSYSDDSHGEIAIITGMHPRETLAKDVVPGVIKEYAKIHHVNIVNYQINVTAYPENFYTGRNNGEYLVAEYVIPDIARSNYSLVIIVHDHEKDYGDDGFYYVTPSMDKKSIDLAENVHKILPDFKYYQRDVTKKAESNSIEVVDDPLVATGTPLFVYEMPEWAGHDEVFSRTNTFLDYIFKVV
jgi:hypothetical protein